MAQGKHAVPGNLATLPQRARSPRVLSAVRDELFRGVAGVVERARPRWPVDTGFSRDELGVEQEPPLTVHAVGRAPYTTSIVSRGVEPWREYIVEPLLDLARRELPRRIADRILKAMSVRR